ncbi:hypothetical protein [Microtetraspora fusca]|uniref:hypothetical protein n=1 Tax=Microtetraspora fusca TaxID=1997 RepID=UPI0012FA3AE2|nr:hypothetical protein [Microtetraspora fusca]
MRLRVIITISLTALVVVGLLVVLWNTGRNDLRIVVVFCAFTLLAGLATWVQLKGHEPSVSRVISSFVTWLFVLAWLIGTPASMYAFMVTAVIGALVAFIAVLGYAGVADGRWIGVITQTALLLLVAFIGHQEFTGADFWTALEVSSIGLAVALVTSFAIERVRAESRPIPPSRSPDTG